MSDHQITFTTGHAGKLAVHEWSAPEPRRIVLLAHGYGEHAGRYAHVADRLVADGAVVVAPDHAGHGLSDGERASISDLEQVVDDVAAVGTAAVLAHPGLPITLVGHSLGSIIAARLAQRDLLPLRSLVLSGALVGGNPALLALADMDPIPEVPIDPAALSRDPAVGEDYASDELVYHGPFVRPTLLTVRAAVESIADAKPLGPLPLLWLHGSEDGLAPVDVNEPAVLALGSSRLEQHLYEGARHEVFNETNRDEVLDTLAEFIVRTTS